MIIVMSPASSQENLAGVEEKIKANGLTFHLSKGEDRTIVGVIGDMKKIAKLEMNMLKEAARCVREGGAQFLRGGAFKPRTSPYDFQGLAEKGLKMLREAADENGLKVVTEIVDKDDMELIGTYADVYQVGARNMQNFQLLKALGKAKKPVMLKRGLSSTISECLNAA